MNIMKTCSIYEFQAIYTTGCKIIGSWPNVTNLKKQKYTIHEHKITEESDHTNRKISSDRGLLGLLLEKQAAPIFRVEVCWERKWLDYVVWMQWILRRRIES
jgi:hypothetical protein